MTDRPVLESPDIPQSAPSSVPLTLAQRARAAQAMWAPAYAQEHRVRRSVSWLVAAILAVYVSGCVFWILGQAELFQRLAVAVLAGYIPLLLVMWAAIDRREGDRSGSTWARAWAILMVEAAAGSGLLASGKYPLGVSYVLSVLGIGAVLAWGLHIPDDPSVDWDLVFFEQLTVVRSARGGHSYAPIIDSPRKAEEIAAAWLRRFGYRDALVTPVGPDDGVDAGSYGAVAQVKWTGRPVRAPDVRGLVGTGKPGQARFFFSKSGYTKPVLRWAADLERPVQLFIMGDDGNLLACNYRAKRSLWHAPLHVPVASRRPAPRSLPWVSIIVGVFALLDAVVLAYVMVRIFLVGQVLLGALFGAGALGMAAVFVHSVYLPAVRITRNVRRGQVAGIRESFSRPRPPEVDKGLPSDAFVGFAPDPIGRSLDWVVDFWVSSRTVHRILRGRKR
jgi:hypothetical protein